MDELINFGGEVKSLDNGHIGGYLVLFGSPESPDLDGDYFTPETDFDFSEGQKTSIYFNHRLPLKTRDGKEIAVKEKIGEGTLSVDDNGVLVDAVLFNRKQYESFLSSTGWSSGTAPHLVDREKSGKAFHVKRWPLGLDASITPIPCNPNPQNQVLTLKSYQESLVEKPAKKSIEIAVKGLFKDKLAEQTPSFWQVQNILSDVVRDIANGARSARVMNMSFDARTLVGEALREFVDAAEPLINTQVDEYAQSTTDDYFYLKTAEHGDALAFITYALKSGRRNSSKDQNKINEVFRLLKELGAEDVPEVAPSDAVKTALDKAAFELAGLELANL